MVNIFKIKNKLNFNNVILKQNSIRETKIKLKRKNKYRFSFRFKNIKHLKGSKIIKSGDVCVIFLFLPKITSFLKKKIIKYQLKWDFIGADKILGLSEYGLKKTHKILAMRPKLKNWKLFVFPGIIYYFAKSFPNVIFSFLKFGKVLVFGFFFLESSNVLGCLHVKNSGKKYRKKSLQHFIVRFRLKRERVYPLRRVKRKRKKRKRKKSKK